MINYKQSSTLGRLHNKKFLNVFCEYTEHQKNGTYGSGFESTTNRNSDDIVINQLFAPGAAVEAGQNAIDNANDALKARINIFDIISYVPLYIPKMA